MQDDTPNPRRSFLKTAAVGGGLAALGGAAGAQSFEFKPNQRYPDASVQILDPSFGKYRIYSSTISRSRPACAGPKARCTFRKAATCSSATSPTTAS